MNEMMTIPDGGGLIAVVDKLLTANPAANVEVVERLLAMQERVNRLNAEKAFNAALAQLQSELPVIHQGGENPALHSKYARYEDIMRAVQPVLSKHGFSIDYDSEKINAQMVFSGTLRHSAGHSRTTTLPIPLASGNRGVTDIQAMGSTVSYAKRYLVMMILNLNTTSEDDDGCGGPEARIAEPQQNELLRLIAEASTTEAAFCTLGKINNIAELQESRFEKARANLMSRIAEREKKNADLS